MSRAILRDLVARDRAVARAIAEQRARAKHRPTPTRCRKCGETTDCECHLVRLGGDE